MSKKNLLMIIGSIILVFTIAITVIFVNKSKNLKNFEITFDTNGGTVIEKQIVKEGEKIIKPVDPVKDGYVFIEWTFEDTTYDFNSIVTQDLILVAKYQEINGDIETYVVKFDSDGGTTISNQIIEKGDIIEKPENPIKEGYTFIGWFLNDDVYDFSSTVENDIELKAKWEEIKQTNNKHNEDSNGKSDNNSSNIKNDITTQPSNQTTSITKKNYTVTFNSNGGSLVSSQTITEGNTAIKPTNPTRRGYNFDGWLLNGNIYNFNDPITSNIILIAKWKKYTVRITSVDQYSPDRILTVYEDDSPISVSSVKYNDIKLCDGNNMVVNMYEINDIDTVTVILKNGSSVIANIQK